MVPFGLGSMDVSNRLHGEINYQLTQLITGHGAYRSYLYLFKHNNSSRCKPMEETAETDLKRFD